MIFFAIRKIGTDNFICHPRQSSGSSWIEAESILLRPPRLWDKKHQASAWLTRWCKGPMYGYKKTYTSPDFFGEEIVTGTITDTTKARDRNLYEIVSMELTERKADAPIPPNT